MNTKADIRLIVMDMDGTLLNRQATISRRNREALRAARKKGVQLAVCSGRLCGDIALHVLEAGLTDCRILSLNGAYCLEEPLGKPYAVHTLAPETLKGCLDILDAYDVTYGCFWQNSVVAMKSATYTRKIGWGSQHRGENAPRFLSGREALEQAIPQGISKILYVEDRHPGRLQEIRQRLLGLPGLDITASWRDNLELMPRGVHKGSAVLELARRLRIPAQSVLTLGDYDNDLGMIACAGYGIAMANASEAVRRAAGYVTLSNEEDGVAEAVYRFAL